MRVTRLRDLVEISPDLWDPQRPSDAGDGLAQAEAFKELLLASQHFRVFSASEALDADGTPTGRHSVRFVMGSPRMEGLDDVERVTRAVCEMDFEFISHVPEYSSGMMVAEMTFPLPALETPNQGALASAHQEPPEVLREALPAGAHIDLLVILRHAQLIHRVLVHHPLERAQRKRLVIIIQADVERQAV